MVIMLVIMLLMMVMVMVLKMMMMTMLMILVYDLAQDNGALAEPRVRQYPQGIQAWHTGHISPSSSPSSWRHPHHHPHHFHDFFSRRWSGQRPPLQSWTGCSNTCTAERYFWRGLYLCSHLYPDLYKWVYINPWRCCQNDICNEAVFPHVENFQTNKLKC